MFLVLKLTPSRVFFRDFDLGWTWKLSLFSRQKRKSYNERCNEHVWKK